MILQQSDHDLYINEPFQKKTLKAKYQWLQYCYSAISIILRLTAVIASHLLTDNLFLQLNNAGLFVTLICDVYCVADLYISSSTLLWHVSMFQFQLSVTSVPVITLPFRWCSSAIKGQCKEVKEHAHLR